MLTATPLWERPMVRDIAKLLSGLIILVVLLLFIIRPLMRSLSSVAKAVVAPVIAPTPQAASANEGPVTRPGTVLAYEQQIAQARSLVAKDPVRVAQVVRDWVEKDE